MKCDAHSNASDPISTGDAADAAARREAYLGFSFQLITRMRDVPSDIYSTYDGNVLPAMGYPRVKGLASSGAVLKMMSDNCQLLSSIVTLI